MVPQEERVFKAVLRWFKYNEDERQQYLPDLLRGVRFAWLWYLWLHADVVCIC